MEKIVKKYVEIMRGGVLYPEYDEEEVEEAYRIFEKEK